MCALTDSIEIVIHHYKFYDSILQAAQAVMFGYERNLLLVAPVSDHLSTRIF